jgi:transcriptional regulator GlxA family with amidase domain
MTLDMTLTRTPGVAAGLVPELSNWDSRSVADAAGPRGMPEQFLSLLRRANTCFETDREGARQCLRDAAQLLAAPASADHLAIPAADCSDGGLTRWQLRRTLHHIESHLASKITIFELARLVAFSRSHFSRSFKRSLRLSPMSYVATRRVERAKLLMRSTSEQLSDIALACGFADQPHLNRSFRRLVGLSPGVWRRTCSDLMEPASAQLP